MSITEDFQQRLRDAMRAKDRPVLDAIRNARTELQKAATAPGFEGNPDDDEFVTDVVGAYVKKLRKALETYEAAGERGREGAEKLRFEIDYLSQWLPRTLDEAATAALVDAAIAETGADSPSKAGQVMGQVMKAHKGKVDPALVKRLVDARLAG